MTKAQGQYQSLQLAHDQLAVQLQKAEAERTALANAMTTRAEALAALEGRCQQSWEHGKGLQGRLDEAAAANEALAADLERSQADLEDKVGGWPRGLPWASFWVLGRLAAYVGRVGRVSASTHVA